MTNLEKKNFLYNHFKKLFNIPFIQDENIAIKENYPQKLYKYRECNDNNFKLFEERKAWFSNPAEWNDPLDYSILLDNTLNPMKFLKKISQSNELYKSLIDSDKKVDLPLDIFCICLLGVHNNLNKNNYEGISSLVIKEAEEIKEKDVLDEKKLEFYRLDRNIKLNLKKVLDAYVEANQKLRKNVGFLCLSETRNNPHQWAIYANEGSGFCIGYSLVAKNQEDKEFFQSLLPIYYGRKERINIIESMADSLMNFCHNIIDDEILQKVFVSAYTKDKKWQGESEWRLSLELKNLLQKGICVDFEFESEIILGEKISKQNEKKLVEIARKLSIPVYKRKLDIFKSKFIIEPYEV